MNRVLLVGRLTRDPEIRTLSTGNTVANFSIAVNRNFRNRDGVIEADFLNIVVYGRQADNIGKYVTKGSQVGIEGRIQTRSYDNNEGKKTYVTEVVASNVQFLESRNSSSNSAQGFDNNNYSQPMPDYNDRDSSNQAAVESVDLDNDPFASFGDSIDVSDNDLPF